MSVKRMVASRFDVRAAPIRNSSPELGDRRWHETLDSCDPAPLWGRAASGPEPEGQWHIDIGRRREICSRMTVRWPWLGACWRCSLALRTAPPGRSRQPCRGRPSGEKRSASAGRSHASLRRYRSDRLLGSTSRRFRRASRQPCSRRSAGSARRRISAVGRVA
jgi:hypothetical protein